MIPKKLLKEILNNPAYATCARSSENTCDGRVTLEHAFTYAGKQIQEAWAILPLCEFHHGVLGHMEDGDLRKDLNQYLCLLRLIRERGLDRTFGQLYREFPRTDWDQLWSYLSSKYNTYEKSTNN